MIPDAVSSSAAQSRPVVGSCTRDNLAPLIAVAFPWNLQLSFALVSRIASGMSYLSAVADGIVIGGLVSRRGRTRWELVSIMVHPNHRKSGVARELVAAMLKEAASAGVSVVAFIRRSNQASRGLAQAMGFHRARVWDYPFCLEEILPWGDHYVWEADVNRQDGLGGSECS